VAPSLRGFLFVAYQDVPGFEVPVNDAFLMPVMHGAADLEEQLQTLPRGQLAGVRVFGDGPSEGNVLHGEPRHLDTRRIRVNVRPGLVDLGDVGVLKASKNLRLEGEPPQR